MKKFWDSIVNFFKGFFTSANIKKWWFWVILVAILACVGVAIWFFATNFWSAIIFSLSGFALGYWVRSTKG